LVVAEAFLGRRPIGLQINHKNGIKSDNRPENLEYVTGSENTLHAMHVIKTRAIGEKQHAAKLTESAVRTIRMMNREGKGLREIAKRFGVTEGCIWFVVKGHSWRHVK